jgi:hypothetical protein
MSKINLNDLKIFNLFVKEQVEEAKEDINKLNILLADKEKPKEERKELRNKIKKINEDMIRIITETYNYDQVQVVNNMMEEHFNKILFDCHGVVYYIKNNRLIYNLETIKRILPAELMKLNYYITTEKEVYNKDTKENETIYFHEPVCKNTASIKSLITLIMASIPINNMFLNDLWNSTLNKIYFENGYYDFTKNQFIKTEDFIAYHLIPRNYNDISNKKIREEIYNKILNPIFSYENEDDIIGKQKRDTFLYKMSRCMSGDYKSKNWFIMIGMRNCGKSVLTSLLQNCFSTYINFTNAENFKVSTTDDIQKKLGWMIDVEFSRLIITQEISIVNKNDKICSATIKKCCSGGDSICARKLHCDPRNFKIQAGLLMCCNDIPPMSHSDVMETCITFNMKSKFIDENYKETKLKSYKYFNKDDGIKDFIERPDVINEFIKILFKAYNNKVELLQEDDNIEEDEASDMTKLLECFEETEDKEDIVEFKHIEELLLLIKSPFSLTKSKKLLINCFGSSIARDGKSRYNHFKKLKIVNRDDIKDKCKKCNNYLLNNKCHDCDINIGNDFNKLDTNIKNKIIDEVNSIEIIKKTSTTTKTIKKNKLRGSCKLCGSLLNNNICDNENCENYEMSTLDEIIQRFD